MRTAEEEKSLLEALSTIKNYEAVKSPKTFFSIIGRSHDEDLISRMILDVLLGDPLAIRSLVDHYDKMKGNASRLIGNLTIDKAKNEEITSGQSRVDMFFLGHDEEGTEFVILFENKIWSWEHDDQTKTYEQWAEKEFKDAARYYFFLKPSFNSSPKKSEKFMNLSFSELSNAITADDVFATDLKKHIKNYLEDRPMDKVDAAILNNYDGLKKAFSEFNDKRDKWMKEFADAVDSSFNHSLVLDYSLGENCYRYYDKGQGWRSGYVKDLRYYFYIEFKIEDGNPSKLIIQKTIKRYAHYGADKVDSFISENRLNYHRWGAYWEDTDPRNKPIIKSLPLTDEWMEETKGIIVNTLQSYYKEQTEVFSAYKEWFANNK